MRWGNAYKVCITNALTDYNLCKFKDPSSSTDYIDYADPSDPSVTNTPAEDTNSQVDEAQSTNAALPVATQVDPPVTDAVDEAQSTNAAPPVTTQVDPPVTDAACVQCTDDGSDWMVKQADKGEGYIDMPCDNQNVPTAQTPGLIKYHKKCKEPEWKNNNWCQQSCFDAGHGYVNCCPQGATDQATTDEGATDQVTTDEVATDQVTTGEGSDGDKAGTEFVTPGFESAREFTREFENKTKKYEAIDNEYHDWIRSIREQRDKADMQAQPQQAQAQQQAQQESTTDQSTTVTLYWDLSG